MIAFLAPLALTAALVGVAPPPPAPSTDGGFMDQAVIVICVVKDACPIGGAK